MARTRQKHDPIVALDVGTTKVACLIAAPEVDGELRVLGVGVHRSRGMRNGQVVDMAALEQSIRHAVDSAEQMAGHRIERVLVNVSGGHLESANVDADVSVAGHAIRDTDVRRILDQGRALHATGERQLVHCMPATYAIDGCSGIIDPRGMYGERLGVRIHLVSTSFGSLKNLETVIDRCDLKIEARIASPYASALAYTIEDDKQTGVTVIDMGGGTTSVCVFVDGCPIFTAALPVGGGHVTNDLARGLSTPVDHAERLKTMHGTAMASPADSREMIRVHLVGEEEEETGGFEVPRQELTHIIRPRIEETFQMVHARLEEEGMNAIAGRRVVLTGGASQLDGVREIAELVMGKQVRLGRPRRLSGLPDSASGPPFATSVGMLRYALRDHVAAPAGDDPEESPTPTSSGRKHGPLRRAFSWLRENF